MVVDYVRSCYVTEMVFGTNPAITAKVRWYFALPGAPLLPYKTPFCSRNWALQDVWPDLGEVQGANRKYDKGTPPIKLPAWIPTPSGLPCGAKSVWENGWPGPVPPSLPRNDLGVPFCCGGPAADLDRPKLGLTPGATLTPAAYATYLGLSPGSFLGASVVGGNANTNYPAGVPPVNVQLFRPAPAGCLHVIFLTLFHLGPGPQATFTPVPGWTYHGMVASRPFGGGLLSEMHLFTTPFTVDQTVTWTNGGGDCVWSATCVANATGIDVVSPGAFGLLDPLDSAVTPACTVPIGLALANFGIQQGGGIGHALNSPTNGFIDSTPPTFQSAGSMMVEAFHRVVTSGVATSCQASYNPNVASMLQWIGSCAVVK